MNECTCMYVCMYIYEYMGMYIYEYMGMYLFSVFMSLIYIYENMRLIGMVLFDNFLIHMIEIELIHKNKHTYIHKCTGLCLYIVP